MHLPSNNRIANHLSRTALATAAVLVAVMLYGLPAGAKDDCPDFSFDCPELFSGDDFTLEDLAEELPLVVHVWAPDCPHCLAHMPYAAALYRKLDLDYVNWVSFSIVGDEDDILEYLGDHDLTFPTLYGEEGEYGDGWEEEGWPTTYVFAKGGAYVGWCDTIGPAYIKEMQELISDAEDCGS